tara:strand:- start:876 stop:1283 length:408 start_codon:yes stop_codon:yes gene_type:complete
MALSNAAYSAVHDKTSSDLTKLEAKFNEGHHLLLTDMVDDAPHLAALVYQIQKMQEELDYLRTEISANKDKTSMTLGTSSNTALAGDTNIVTIGSNTTIAFGDMQSKTVKGKTTYQIIMTVTNGGVSKTITHTLA